jgi:hypothetical protein
MGWGTIELEGEVVDWLAQLEDETFGQAERYIDLLAEEGVHLGEPFTRVLLTVFVKTQRQERREIDRAEKAMQRCIAEGHTVQED